MKIHTFTPGPKLKENPDIIRLHYTRTTLSHYLKGLLFTLKEAEVASDDDIIINLHGTVTTKESK